MSGVTCGPPNSPYTLFSGPPVEHSGPCSSILTGLWRNTLHIIELKESDPKKGRILLTKIIQLNYFTIISGCHLFKEKKPKAHG